MASETEICNMALGRIGAKRISGFTDNNEDNPQIVQCRLHYTQTRDALLRSHWWRFARSRVALSANTTSPTFEYDNAYDLPNDFLRLWLKPFEDNDWGRNNSKYTYSLEGKQLLSNESTMKIRYIRKVTDVTEFDPLFTEVLVLKLALKMVMPLSQDMKLYQGLYAEMRDIMRRVRVVDKQETNTVGDADRGLWNDARFIGSGGNPAKSHS
jgi:hypothetical protein